LSETRAEYFNRVDAGSGLSEALVFFLASQVSVLGVMVFMPVAFAVLVLGPVLFVVWILSSFCAYRHIAPKPPRADDIMVRYGCPARPGTIWGYSLLVASLSGDLLAAFAVEIGIAWSSATGRWGDVIGLFLHVVSLLFLILAVVAFWKARGYYLEVAESQTMYASPVQYSVLGAAERRLVILGNELQHAAHISTSTAADLPEALPGEVRARTLQIRVGEDRPFCLELGKERNPHCVVFGSAGTGKSEAVKTIALRYWLAKHIPFLVLDRTGEYASFVRDVGGVVWAVPEDFTVNPLRLGGYSPHQRAGEIEESLTCSVELSPLQASEVSRTVLEAYIEAGIDENDESTWKRTPPTWDDIISLMEAKVRSGEYSGQQLESVNWTIRKLRRVSRVFGEEQDEFFDVVLKVPVCVDMSGLRGADIAKSILTHSLLQRIYSRFELRGSSDLSLLVVIDEAHLILKTEEKKAAITQEPLLIRIVRLARKYGFAIVIACQLASDIPEAALANAATVIALMFDEPRQVNYIKKFLNLSKHELEIYARLPPGACFVKSLGRRYAALVKVQMVSNEEIQAAKALTERVRLPKPVKPEGRLRTVLPTSHEDASLASEVFPTSRLQTRNERAEARAKDARTALPKEVSQQSVASNETTLLEKKVLCLLEKGPVTMKELLGAFPSVGYREMLRVLESLQTQGIMQESKVANLRGKGTVFYAALRPDWAQSESVEHRAMVDMIAQALEHLRPVRYMRTEADSPDVGLEVVEPKGCVEVETGRKKLTPSELEKWAAGVEQRNRKLGYKDTLVVVPNSAIEARYKDSCEKHGLELTTMAKLGAKLEEKQEGEGCSPA